MSEVEKKTLLESTPTDQIPALVQALIARSQQLRIHSDYHSALEGLKLAYEIANQKIDPLAETLLMTGSIERSVGNVEKASKTFQDALSIGTLLNNQSILAKSLHWYYPV